MPILHVLSDNICYLYFRGHDDTVASLSLRGNVLYSAGADGHIRVWHLDELRKGSRLTIKGHEGAVRKMGLSKSDLTEMTRHILHGKKAEEILSI